MSKRTTVRFIVALIFLVPLWIIALQPADFRVTRSAKIDAPPQSVFPHVNDFHQWTAWSPWEKMDPAMQRTFSGESQGAGAEYAWVGNDQVGEGKMTITESKPNDLVHINLEFIKPFAATSQTEFSFKPEGDGTQVTWDMSGKNSFIAKAMCLFMNMDQMVGGDFEKGLADLKAAVEGEKKSS